MQKKVLMITRSYFPSNASSVHRSVGFAKYLPFFGWTPIVVCRKFTLDNSPASFDEQLASLTDSCEVIRVDPGRKLIEKIENRIWQAFGGGDSDYRYPYTLHHRMKSASEHIIRREKIDVIWSTYMPGMDHKIANCLSKRFSIPWVADFRDLPDQSESNRNINFTVKQEIKFCSYASILVATTEELAQKLRTRHTVPVHTIFNGFDPDDYIKKETEFFSKSSNFSINHFGNLSEYRNPAPLFVAIDILSKENRIDLEDIKVNFYGANSKIVGKFAQNYRCSNQIKVPGRLLYNEMIAYQKQSQILLLVAPPEQGGAIPGKLYSYLASHRPILNVPGDGAGTDRIIQKTESGTSSSDPKQIACWLEKAYMEWKQNGSTKFMGIDSEIQKYSRKNQAEQLANLLQMVCS